MSSEANSVARLKLDVDAARRAQQGDPDAFAWLFYANKARVYALCLRLTNQRLGGRGSDPGCLSAGVPETVHVSRRFSIFHVAASRCCQHGADVLP